MLEESDVKVEKLNCDENQKACQIYGITQYPTLKLFENGHVERFYGTLDASEIFLWVKDVEVKTAFVLGKPFEKNPEVSDDLLDFDEYDKEGSVVYNMSPGDGANIILKGNWVVQLY